MLKPSLIILKLQKIWKSKGLAKIFELSENSMKILIGLLGTMSPAVSNRQKRHLYLCLLLLPDDNPYGVNNCLNMIIGYTTSCIYNFYRVSILVVLRPNQKITSVLRESDPKSRQLHFMDFNVSAVTCTA